MDNRILIISESEATYAAIRLVFKNQNLNSIGFVNTDNNLLEVKKNPDAQVLIIDIVSPTQLENFTDPTWLRQINNQQIIFLLPEAIKQVKLYAELKNQPFYIFKPYNSKLLSLVKYILGNVQTSSVKETPKVGLNNLPVLNEDALAPLLSYTANDSAMLKQLFTSFIDDMDKLVKQAGDAINSKNQEETARAIHTLKGLSGTIGASRVYMIAQEIDQNCKTSNINMVKLLWPSLQKQYGTLHALISEKYLK